MLGPVVVLVEWYQPGVAGFVAAVAQPVVDLELQPGKSGNRARARLRPQKERLVRRGAPDTHDDGQRCRPQDQRGTKADNRGPFIWRQDQSYNPRKEEAATGCKIEPRRDSARRGGRHHRAPRATHVLIDLKVDPFRMQMS